MFLIPIGRQQQKPRLTGRKFKSDQAHEQSLAPTANKRVKQHSIRPLRMAARAEPMMREAEFAGSVTYNSQSIELQATFSGIEIRSFVDNNGCNPFDDWFRWRQYHEQSFTFSIFQRGRLSEHARQGRGVSECGHGRRR